MPHEPPQQLNQLTLTATLIAYDAAAMKAKRQLNSVLLPAIVMPARLMHRPVWKHMPQPALGLSSSILCQQLVPCFQATMVLLLHTVSPDAAHSKVPVAGRMSHDQLLTGSTVPARQDVAATFMSAGLITAWCCHCSSDCCFWHAASH